MKSTVSGSEWDGLARARVAVLACVAVIAPLRSMAPQVQPEPPVVVLSRLEPEFRVKLEAECRRLTEDRPSFRDRAVRVRAAAAADPLPSPKLWDLAVGYTSIECEAASRDTKLAEWPDGGYWREVWIVPYAPIGTTGHSAPLWTELFVGGQDFVLMPDARADPAFKEALASLVPQVSFTSLRVLMRRASTAQASPRIREMLAADPLRNGVVALRRSEVRAGERPPAARLCVARSSASSDAAGTLLDALMRSRARWLGASVGFASSPAAAALVLARPDMKSVGAIEKVIWGRVLQPDDDESPEWLDTAMLGLFGGLFVLIVVVASRKRRPLSGTR